MNTVNHQPFRFAGGQPGLASSHRTVLWLLLTGLLALPAAVTASTLGPLIELSRPNPVGSCDDGFRLPGIWTLDDAAEPYVAANPSKPNNVVAAWILGPLQNLIAGVSLNGGRTWQQVPLPLTVCSGGSLVGTGDPCLSFAANGDLYAIGVAGSSLATRGVTVLKSTDGGQHWSAPVILTGNSYDLTDRPTITADPTDARFAYAFWQRNNRKQVTPAVFSRTTDGGLTWEPPRTLVDPAPQTHVDSSQAIVLPDGTLIDLYNDYYQGPNQLFIKQQSVRVLRSSDHGQTWSAPSLAFPITPFAPPNASGWFTVDPETGQFVHEAGSPAFAVDRRNGSLYAVWEDGRFSSFQNNDIAFSMSADAGLTWSTPVRINQAPLSIPPLNRQAFLPSIAVATDGTIGVSYYDFRFNDPNPGLPTDYWLVQCHPPSNTAPANPANWGGEVRLTDSSFDLEASIIFVDGGLFLGDYVGGLTAAGDDFVATFTRVDPDGVNSIVARRVGK